MSHHRTRPLRALSAGLAVAATVATLGAVPSAAAVAVAGAPTTRQVAAPTCDRPEPKALPAVKAVDRARQVPAQEAGALATSAVRSAVRDELAAERQGEWARRDGALWLDRCSQAFYVEPTAPRVQRNLAGGTTQVQGADQQLFPLAETFTLSSRPGAARTLYLDFTGHAISGTAWNGRYGYGSSATLPAYDYEGGAGVFTDAERINIQNVWAMVAEDYAPFDINVTTADPGQAAITRDGAEDTAYGTRAVVTNDTVGQGSCGCGGIAYVGVFNNSSNHAYYQPALVFTRGVGHGAKNVAEALSHEVGHNLGLVHQGVAGGAGYYTGHGSWAPIMGVGYYKPISQWARGEYANASSTQDELATIVATGLPHLADDHGDTAAAATELTGALSAGVAQPGVISTPSDVDAFTLTLPSSGDLTVDASPAAVGANLDLRAVVRDAGGNVVADVDPLSSSTYADRADNLGARVLLTGLAAGTYSVSLEGVGARTAATDGYTDYGSLGAYELAVTAVSSDAPVVTSPAPGELTTGVVYRHAFAATAVDGGGLHWSLTGTLPTGVTFDAASGTISGRTTVKGVFPVVVTVVDDAGREASRTYQLRSAGPLVAGSLTTRAAAVAGTAWTGQLAAVGGTTPYTWTAVTKPAWATVSASGAITGVPTTAGPDVFLITVTDAAGRTTTRQYTVNVGGSLAVRDLTGRLGTSVGGTVVAGLRFSFPVPAYGGKRAYTYTADALPAGVTMSAYGAVTGTIATPGTYPLTVTVRDYLGAQVTKTLVLRVVDRFVLDGVTPPATSGQAFTATFTPTGGVAPYTVIASGVPDGLTFDAATGVLSGTPTTISTRSAVLFKITDSVGRVVTRRVALPVRAPVAASTTTLPAASVGRSYSGRLLATGGTGRFTWTLASGSLPPGVTLTTTGLLRGYPTETGTWGATFTARDTEGRTVTTGTLDIVVADPVTLATTVLPTAAIGQAWTQTISAVGGTGSYTFSTTTRLPAWLSLSSSGVISGTPPASTTVYVAVKVTDSAGRFGSRTYAVRAAL